MDIEKVKKAWAGPPYMVSWERQAEVDWLISEVETLRQQLVGVKRQTEIDIIKARGFANKEDFESLIRTKNSACNTQKAEVDRLITEVESLRHELVEYQQAKKDWLEALR